MAEAHNQFLRGDELENAFFCCVGCVEALDKLHGCLVGPRVGDPQGADGAGDGRVEIRQRRSDGARGESRCVEFVLGVENERRIDGPAMQLIGLMTVQQMEEMPGGAVVVCCCFDTFAALLEVVPIEKHGAKAGSQPVGYSDLIAGSSFGL